MRTTSTWKAVCFAFSGLAIMTVPASAQTTKFAVLGDEELIALIDRAKTPVEHERLAAYYDLVAQELDRKMTKYRDVAASYRARPVPIFPKISPPVSYASYYDGLAVKVWRSAKEAAIMAEHHRMLAKATSFVSER